MTRSDTLRRRCLVIAIASVAGCSRTPAEPDPLASLQLERGERWVADEHTKTQLAAMIAAVQAAAGDSSAARTASLGAQLQQIADRLVQGCTMTGPAHDALHGYLGALLPPLHSMTATDVAAARRARAQVESILPRFDDFFR